LGQYDSIVIGAGHNGLICAAYLAQSGQRVLVIEASDRPGGLGADREFHPGFHTSVAHSVSHFSSKVAKDLKLSSHGFDTSAEALATIGLSPNGEHVVLRDGRFESADQASTIAYQKYSAQMQRFASVLEPFWQKTMPRFGSADVSDLLTFGRMGLNIRMLGKKDMQEFMRIASLPARDLMDENFENEIVKAMLSWDGLIGSRLAPRSPNSAVLAMLYRMAGASNGAHTVPAGGVAGLINALSAATTAAGAEIRYDAKVGRVLIDGDSDGLVAKGVQLVDGEKIEATRVISGATNRIRRLRCDGLVAKLHLALEGTPKFTGLSQADGRMIAAPSMDAIEFAFDHSKYGECPTDPVMEILVPSLHDASLAPSGQHVLSAHVMYVPYKLKGGWTDAARDQMCSRAVDTIARYAPGIREQIIHQEFLTPADLEQQYRVSGGHWHHTEMAMDQMLMMRPTYEAAQYRTPIPGLFLCGAGCHPGGDIMGGAGHNAAREILR